MPVVGGELHSNGLFRSVRHPIYSGIIAIAIGSAVRSGSAVVAAATLLLIGWLMLKARWEERLLLDRYPGYASYAARTPRFVPFAIRHRPR
jgi:protein-S-isoprenylcysteine O-methyltransferase Ste14